YLLENSDTFAFFNFIYKTLPFIQKGKDISLYCSFSHYDTSVISWFKQIPGEKALLIASSSNSAPTYHNNFDKSGRFNASTEKGNFTLNIRHAEASDSATYFCAAAYYTAIAVSDCTVLVLRDTPSSLYTVLQPPVSDPVRLGGDTTLQCSILTDNSAGDHSVYWFRHGSGESDPGIIFTHGNRSDQCKKSSETVSPTQSCIYKLPKNSLSLSDAGTYYCAVAACGHIFFGDGTKLDLRNQTGAIHIWRYIIIYVQKIYVLEFCAQLLLLFFHSYNSINDNFFLLNVVLRFTNCRPSRANHSALLHMLSFTI
uniref:Ig-like domain-containing protein n=1 Tax=Astyanax mexicanus TaxID=7994 RepID=A0A3B1JRD8_ASTMX